MSVYNAGDFPEDHTKILIPFNTFTSNDPSASSTITDLADADIKVHKDGSTDEIVTDGATVVINFDGVTGNHLITIDSSVDAAYTTGAEYTVRIEGTTVDGATINAWVGAFSIERAGGVIALLKLIQAAVITNAAGTDVAADIIAVKAETATIVNDTDVIDDATSGLVKIASDVAAVLVDTGTTIPGTITTAQTDLDTITGTGGVLIGTDAMDRSGTLDVNTKTITNGIIAAATLGADCITSAKIADNAIAAEHLAAGAIDNATFAADVGSTAHATNIISLAARKGLDDYDPPTKAELDTAAALAATPAEVATALTDINLDHLMKTAVADRDVMAEVVDGTVLANIMTKTDGDTSDFDPDTDSLEAVRDKLTDIETDTGTTLDTLIKDIPTVSEFEARTLPTASATKLGLSAGVIVAGTVSHDNTAASTTVFYSDDITEATADHYIGRIVIFTSGALIYQATDITDYALDTGEGKFTVTALTEAPADNVTFIIV